jgi:two-component system, LuxR family, response regulator DctR
MPSPANSTVYIVDDDASVREALSWMLRTKRLHNESFESAEVFLAEQSLHFPSFSAKFPSCLLLDIRMPSMTGLELFENISATQLIRTVPVIFLTGHADVATAVDAVKRGAFDFCEKPFSNNLLIDRIEAALHQSELALNLHRQELEIQDKILDLTEREQAVMQLVVKGLPNKLIADHLSISVRTVEVHRARVFEKMDVNSAVELANLVRTSRHFIA